MDARMKDARLATARRLGKTVSQGEMAQRVTEALAALGRADLTVSQAAWSAYERGANEPKEMTVFMAIEDVSGIWAGDVAFGRRGARASDESREARPPRTGTDDSAQG